MLSIQVFWTGPARSYRHDFQQHHFYITTFKISNEANILTLLVLKLHATVKKHIIVCTTLEVERSRSKRLFTSNCILL